MIGDIKKALGKSAVYSLGNMSTKLIGLLLIPLYTDQDYLNISEYGALGILEITSQVLAALMSLALATSFSRWYWDKKFENRQKSIFFTSLFTLVSISTIFLILVIPFSDSISKLLFHHTDYSYVIVLVMLYSVLQIIFTQVLTLLKLQSRALFYSIISVSKLSISLLLTIYFIVYKGKSLEGIFEAQLIASVVALSLLLPTIYKNLRFKLELSILREMLRFSLPLMLASISGVFFTVIDRFSLNYIEGLEKVGIYSLGYKISSTLKVVVISSVQLALAPILMKKINDPNNKRFFSKVMTYFSFGMMFCVIGLSLFNLEVIKVATRDILYWESSNIVAILAFSFFFGMLKDATFIGFQVVKRTRIAGLMIALSSFINLGLNLLLIPRYSIYGAAIATLISQIIFFVMMLTAAQRMYRIPYELSRVMMILFAGVLLVVAGFFLNNVPIGLRMVLKSLLLLSYPFVLYLLRFYNSSELENIRKILSAWKKPSELISNVKRILDDK